MPREVCDGNNQNNRYSVDKPLPIALFTHTEVKIEVMAD